MTARRFSLVDEVRKIEHVPAYMTDTSGNITVWNSNAAQLFGLEEQDVLGKSEAELYVDPNEMVNLGGARFTWRVCKNGNHLFLQETVIEIKDPDSEKFKFMKILEDHTSQLSLREKCELWFEQFDKSNQKMAVTDHKLDFVFLTDALAGMLGYSVDELIGTSALRVVTPYVAENSATIVREVTKRPDRALAFKYIRKDGTYVFAKTRALEVVESGERFILGYNEEVHAEQIKALEEFI